MPSVGGHAEWSEFCRLGSAPHAHRRARASLGSKCRRPGAAKLDDLGQGGLQPMVVVADAEFEVGRSGGDGLNVVQRHDVVLPTVKDRRPHLRDCEPVMGMDVIEEANAEIEWLRRVAEVEREAAVPPPARDLVRAMRLQPALGELKGWAQEYELDDARVLRREERPDPAPEARADEECSVE